MATFSREVPLDIAGLAAAQDELEAFLAGQGIDLPMRNRVRLVLEEIVANLLLHGRFAGERLPARLGVALAPGEVLVTLDDAAAPFDPREEPADGGPVTSAEPGGRGLPLIRRLATIRDYRRTPDGWNRLELAFRYG
jgi:anti-sigma regulatory factor (Ser/Thr protein kinase)